MAEKTFIGNPEDFKNKENQAWAVAQQEAETTPAVAPDTAFSIAQDQFKAWDLSEANKQKLASLVKEKEAWWMNYQDAITATQEQLKWAVAPTQEVKPTNVLPEDKIETLTWAPVWQTPTLTETPTEVKPTETPTPTEKVTDIQTIESNKLINEQEQAKVEAEKKTKALTDFENALKSWASIEDLSKIANANKWYRQDFNNLVKTYFKNSANAKFYNKYSGLWNDALLQEYKSWNIVPWSEQYNLLPEPQRKAFENYLKIDQARNIWDEKAYKEQFATDNNKIISLQDIIKEYNTLFSSDYRKKSEELLNSQDIKGKAQELEDAQTEINGLSKSIKSEAKRIRESMKWAPESFIQARIADATDELEESLTNANITYQTKLATYQSLRENAKTELEIYKYEDTINRENYKLALNMYETKRQELRQDELIELEEQSKIQAEKRQQDWQLALIENERKYEAENKKGVYQTDKDWNLLYIIDWQANTVKWADWKVVWITRVEEYSDTVSKNDDWTISVLRAYNDWRKPQIFNYWVNWQNNLNVNMWAYDIISQLWTEDLWCGEFTNDYVNKWWLVTTEWNKIRVWDSYESKKDYVNNYTPQVWWLAVWNPNPSWKYWENGHIWIVTWYNPETWEVEITDSNYNWDKKVTTHKLNVSEIVNSDWWFVHITKPWVEQDIKWWYTDAQIWVLSSIDTLTPTALKALEEAGLTSSDYWLFKWWWLPPTRTQTLSAKTMINDIDALLTHTNLSDAVWSLDVNTPTLFGKTNDFINKFDSLISNITKDNLWLLKWPMSDKDVAFIKSMSSAINRNTDEETFKENLRKLKAKYTPISQWLAIPDETIQEVDMMSELNNNNTQVNDWKYFNIK